MFGRRRSRPGSVLVDPGADRRLHRDGFVKVRALSAAAAGDLRQAYGDVHGWTGEGFAVDFWEDRPGYRQAASAAISGAVDEAVQALFVDHRPFLRNFLVKWPGLRDPQGFPEGAHRDWMYTDERAGTHSWVVWIALEDVTGHNGQLKVARGSHRIDDRLRGTNIATPWLDHHEVWDQRLLTVPALAGEAVITDAATVHGSHFNLSSDPRVAVAVAVAPRGAQLVHYWADGDDQAQRFEVDESFFIDQPAAALMQAPPTLEPTGRVPIGGRDVAAHELARLLDRQPLAVLDRVQANLSRRSA